MSPAEIIKKVKSITAKRIFAEHPEVRNSYGEEIFGAAVFLCRAWGAT